MVAQQLALPPHSFRVLSLLDVSVEFNMFSLCVCVGSLQVLWFPPTSW